MARDDEFTEFVAARGSALRRSAFLMTGDWHEAEDLAQNAFARLYVAWPRVRIDGAEAYARTALTRLVIDSRRRMWRRESPSDRLPESPAVADGADDRVDLARALALLPTGQRVVLVLRFWDDLSVEQAATTLGISSGTVKSRTSRGLETLRSILGTHDAWTTEEVAP